MSPTQEAMLAISQSIFAMSLSGENCATLKNSIRSSNKNNPGDPQLAEKKIADDSEPGILSQENMSKKATGKRRHSSTPDPVERRKPSIPVPRRNARSLTEITVDTEIIDGLLTTTLCSTEL